jgi:hypothetical protein
VESRDASPAAPAPLGAPKLATAGFMLGVFGLAESVVFGLFEDLFPYVGITLAVVPAVLAIILGAIGLRQASRRGAPTGLGRAGVICGIVALVVVVASVLVYFLLRGLGIAFFALLVVTSVG